MSIQCCITRPSHRCLLKCRNEYITEARHLLKQNSPMSCSIALPANCGPRRGKGKASEAKDSSRGSAGFGRERKELWSCSQGCGACCKLDKGPAFATPEEIFDDPDHVKLYRSMIGTDGWCIHFEKTTRTCSIYQGRPYFCRVEPKVFEELYGINEKKFNKEACSCCRDTIKAVYGVHSEELDNFNLTIRNSSIG
ncbi:Retinoic acid-induced 3 [Cinnamomum micranthum f. kanehirae]|uniref:Retinoic acid-induced 3 n=1 Tax=Cinnamomum micranthum f. kanehirae TaxID=337451 RepID=A0A3S3NTC0_9MAGN|nr:Retinoic acid-induced 3 [Cinnamomum micranthum f. kanehirae]